MRVTELKPWSFYRVGMKFELFRIFFIFLAITVKTVSFSNQTVKFEFKRATWTNQEPPRSYCPPAPGAGSSVGATDWPLPPGSSGLKRWCSRSLPAPPEWAVPPSGRTLLPSRQAVAPAIESSLRTNTFSAAPTIA
jgi:hypothetical protein